MLWTDNVKQGLHEEPTAYLTLQDWRTESCHVADMAFFRGEPSVILGGDTPDRVLSEFVSANLFGLVGVAPALGRTFTQDEQDRGESVVVLSYGLWQRRFGAAHDVISLLLARGAARARELAIRTSLGAGRSRLLRQLVTETTILTIVAGIFGLMLASAGLRVLVSVAPVGIYPESGSSYVLTDSVPILARSAQPGIPRLDEVSVDTSVLAFTVALSFLSTFAFGLLPAWRMSQADPSESLKQGAGPIRSRSSASRSC